MERIRACIERLEAWIEGEQRAQIAAETRRDTVEAEGHYNRVRNYQGLVDTLRDFEEDSA